MKLPDFENFEPFNKLRRAMGGVELGSFSLNYKGKGLTKEELDALFSKGIDVDFKDITKLDDGTLAYKDKRVLVYIRDIGDYSMHYKRHTSDVESLPKFHVSWCRALSEKHDKNQFGRYVVSQNVNGDFAVCVISGNKVVRQSTERLRICKNCLEIIGWEEYSRTMQPDQKTQIVSKFLIPDFFEKYPRELVHRKPEHSDLTSPLNMYSEDFGEIGTRLKEKLNWECQGCNRNLGEKHLRKYLHVHHINSQKNDNRGDNLKALCLKCHAEEDGHGHMKNERYREFLKILVNKNN